MNGAITGREEPAAVWRTIEAQARLVAGRGWHVQALINPKTLSAIADRIAGLPCTLVIDHLGLPDIEAGPAATSFSALVSLVEAGRVHVKLSAMERLAGRGRLERLRPFIDRLLAAGADRLVWGTDWPHTGGARTPGQPVEAIEPFAVVDDADALALLRDVVRGSNALQSILVETPARLYDFGIAQ